MTVTGPSRREPLRRSGARGVHQGTMGFRAAVGGRGDLGDRGAPARERASNYDINRAWTRGAGSRSPAPFAARALACVDLRPRLPPPPRRPTQRSKFAAPPPRPGPKCLQHADRRRNRTELAGPVRIQFSRDIDGRTFVNRVRVFLHWRRHAQRHAPAGVLRPLRGRQPRTRNPVRVPLDVIERSRSICWRHPQQHRQPSPCRLLAHVQTGGLTTETSNGLDTENIEHETHNRTSRLNEVGPRACAVCGARLSQVLIEGCERLTRFESRSPQPPGEARAHLLFCYLICRL